MLPQAPVVVVVVVIIPVLIGETGTISKSLREFLSNILGGLEMKEVQKTAILGTAHKLQKVLKSSSSS
jgi:hypothetical protein